MRATTIQTSSWPRFAEYEVIDGRVAPSSSTFETYDAWQSYRPDDTDSGPQQALLELAFSYRTLPPPDFDSYLAAWANAHGLLGLALCRIIHTTCSTSEGHGWGATRSGGRLLLTQTTAYGGPAISDQFPDMVFQGPIPETVVANPRAGGTPLVQVLEPLTYWKPYIPNFEQEAPEIGSARFWQLYGEPVAEIVRAALEFEREVAMGLSIWRMMDDAALDLSKGVPSYRSVSLFGAFAAMAADSRAGGLQYVRCDCGRLFSARKRGDRPMKKYCSERCKARVKQRRARASRASGR